MGALKNVSWSVLFLVAGLFIMVEALNKTGIIAILKNFLNQSIQSSINTAIWSGSIIIALACNLMNNLPVGLIAGSVVQNVQTPEIVKQFILISIDLGPNLSITGSLATILWIVTLRREGVILSPRSFFKLGALIMTVSLLLTIASIVLF